MVVSKKAVSWRVTEEKTLVLRAAVIRWPLSWQGRTVHLGCWAGQYPPSSGRFCRSYTDPPAGTLQSDPSIPGQVQGQLVAGAKDGGMADILQSVPDGGLVRLLVLCLELVQGVDQVNDLTWSKIFT